MILLRVVMRLSKKSTYMCLYVCVCAHVHAYVHVYTDIQCLAPYWSSVTNSRYRHFTYPPCTPSSIPSYGCPSSLPFLHPYVLSTSHSIENIKAWQPGFSTFHSCTSEFLDWSFLQSEMNGTWFHYLSSLKPCSSQSSAFSLSSVFLPVIQTYCHPPLSSSGGAPLVCAFILIILWLAAGPVSSLRDF